MRFRTIEKEGVPAYDPPSPAVPVVLDESFGEFLLTKRTSFLCHRFSLSLGIDN